MKKVSVVWKNGKYVFCSLKWDLLDANDFGPQMLTFCWLKAHFCLKVTQKTLKIMGWLKWGGFIVLGLQTLILKPDEVQSVLWTLPKRFSYTLSTWCSYFGWNLSKLRFWPFFLTIFMCKQWYIVSLHFHCGYFFGATHQIYQSNPLKTRAKKLHLWKILQDLLLF